MPPMPPGMGMPPDMGMQPGMGMPGMDPMMGMMPPQPPQGMRRDPMVEMAALRDALANTEPMGPVYPRWLGEVKKPNPAKMCEYARKRFEEYASWRGAVRHDLRMVRMQESGIFPDDAPDVQAKIMEAYESHGLVDEYNLAVSWLSGMQKRVVKHAQSDETKGDARKVKLACELLMAYEAECHTDKGEMPSRIVEPKVMLGYGVLAKRRVLDRFAEPYDSPFITRYIDPAQLVPEFDDRGLKRIFRVYSAKVGDIANTYGDFPDSVKKKLETKYGKFDDDLEITNIVEYWDRWWRFVGCEGDDILPLTAHKYGEVPYTIGFGPLGEPNLTMLPDEHGAAAMVNETWQENLPYKSVPYVRFIKRSHILHEALMSRYLYGVKVELWPPILRMRSLAASTKPAPDMDSSPGATNEGMYGEEDIKAYPFPPSSQSNRMLLVDALNKDMSTGRAPLSAYGQMDQSNISGTANKQAAQAGLHHWKPWAAALESFHGRDLSKAMRIWQRLGNVVEYGDSSGGRRPFVVPVQKPYANEASSFELKKDTISKVGANVTVTMASVNPEEWLLRSQAIEQMSKQGFSMPYLADMLLGIDYDPQMFEEWQEEQAIKQAMAHPRFLELVVIPSMLDAQIAENEDDPEQIAVLMHYRQMWDQLQVQPAMMEHQMKMQQMAAIPGPGESPDHAGGGGGGIPPTTSGVSLPEMGSGPGSVTGNQGGPQGPLGPRSQY
jgi:hypothetical protein